MVPPGRFKLPTKPFERHALFTELRGHMRKSRRKARLSFCRTYTPEPLKRVIRTVRGLRGPWAAASETLPQRATYYDATRKSLKTQESRARNFLGYESVE